MFKDYTWVLLCVMFACISLVVVALDAPILSWWYLLVPLIANMKWSEKK